LNLRSSQTSENVGWSQKNPSVSAPGFLGQTSYSDVFTDTKSGVPAEALSLGGHDTVPVDTKRVSLGAQVLALLENLPFYRDLITSRFKIWKGWTIGWPITNMVFTIVEEMWNHSDYDGMDLCKKTLLLSRNLFETHTRALEVRPSMSWEDFKTESTGRWEVIGLLFVLTGITTDWISHDDPLFSRQGAVDAKKLAITATAVGDTCLQFCDSSGIINDIVSWLLLHQTSLLAMVYGESGT
jgi:chromatin structure-remodeling complex subunit RSC3/30